MQRGRFGTPFGHPFERGRALAGRQVRLAQASYPPPPEISVEEYVQRRDAMVQAWEDSGRTCLVSLRYITVDPEGQKRFMQGCRFPDGSSAGTSAPVAESSLATKPCDEAWAWKCQNEEAAMGNPACPGQDPGPVLCSVEAEPEPELPCVTPPTTGNPACPPGQIEAYAGTGECYRPCICVVEGGQGYATYDADTGIKKRTPVTGMWLRDQGVDVDPATPFCPGAEEDIGGACCRYDGTEFGIKDAPCAPGGIPRPWDQEAQEHLPCPSMIGCPNEDGTFDIYDADTGDHVASNIDAKFVPEAIRVQAVDERCGPAPAEPPAQTTTPTAAPTSSPSSVPSGPPSAPTATTLSPPAAGFQPSCNPGRPGMSGRFHRDFFGRSMF